MTNWAWVGRLVWLVLLLAWGVALLMPVPEAAKEAVGGADNAFWFGKFLHVSVYAVLGAGAWLAFAGRVRVAALVGVFLHGVGTELGQFVTVEWSHRTGTVRDAVLDTVGLGVGVGLAWLARRPALTRPG